MAQEQTNNDLTYCELCNKLLWDNRGIDEDYHYIDEMIVSCCDCFHQKYFECDQCNEAYELENKKEIDYDWYCTDCYNEIIQLYRNKED